MAKNQEVKSMDMDELGFFIFMEEMEEKEEEDAEDGNE